MPLDAVDEKFLKCCFILSESDIIELEKEDNGQINNVIVGLNKHCYGVKVYDDKHGLTACMFFIDGKNMLKGDIINIDIKDPDYYELLLRFCVMLSRDYKNIEPVNAFNTFQNRLRTGLEKLNFFTFTNLDIKPRKGETATLVSLQHRGIIKVEVIEIVPFYRQFFHDNYYNEHGADKEYVYLMLNTQTSAIKIGTSKDPKYREGTLQSKEPCVHLIAKWCCDKSIEKKLHLKYSEKRNRGEWFSLSFSDLIEIEVYMNALEIKQNN